MGKRNREDGGLSKPMEMQRAKSLGKAGFIHSFSKWVSSCSAEWVVLTLT